MAPADLLKYMATSVRSSKTVVEPRAGDKRKRATSNDGGERAQPVYYEAVDEAGDLKPLPPEGKATLGAFVYERCLWWTHIDDDDDDDDDDDGSGYPFIWLTCRSFRMFCG